LALDVYNKLEQKTMHLHNIKQYYLLGRGQYSFQERPSVKFQVDTSTAAAAALEQSLMM
jgi:hypothetical protein